MYSYHNITLYHLVCIVLLTNVPQKNGEVVISSDLLISDVPIDIHTCILKILLKNTNHLKCFPKYFLGEKTVKNLTKKFNFEQS